VTALYGVAPEIRFAEIGAIVDNHEVAASA
jgi:hypothetical protein